MSARCKCIFPRPDCRSQIACDPTLGFLGTCPGFRFRLSLLYEVARFRGPPFGSVGMFQVVSLFVFRQYFSIMKLFTGPYRFQWPIYRRTARHFVKYFRDPSSRIAGPKLCKFPRPLFARAT